jgi:SAM-dependent methyltransferase
MNILRELHGTLKCPDDGGELRMFDGCLECMLCKRQHPVLAANMVELLPLEASLLGTGSAYATGYTAERETPFVWRRDSLAWGAPEAFPRKWVERKYRQVAAVRRLLNEDAEETRSLFCDFSAGAGYYTLAYATDWRSVMHCDLSVDSLNYAHRKAARLGIDNILFVRMDYLRPPFRRGLQRVVCLDSLIRGESHEKLLLQSIRNSLDMGGAAIVDFHNWWHNPLRRVGLLRNNFGANRSYRKRELNRLFAAAGIAGSNCFPFHQESSPSIFLRRTLPYVLPPTRWICRFSAGTSLATH